MNDDLVSFLRALYGDADWPKPFHILQGVLQVEQGRPISDVAKVVRTSAKRLYELAGSPDPALSLLQISASDLAEQDLVKRRGSLGGQLLARASEIAFEDIYRVEMATDEFELTDVRVSRTDTDYRLLNGRRRALYRINIKSFRSLFRLAPEMVSLEPEDCFPLATYKIYLALRRQEDEHLPYIFMVVSVPDLDLEQLEAQMPKRLVTALALIFKSEKVVGKRNYEDKAADSIVASRSPSFEALYRIFRTSSWYVLSARKANNLLREKLFDRVFALRIKNFNQAFKAAELDMHFSLKDDLVPLTEFLHILRDQGQPTVTSMLERGTI